MKMNSKGLALLKSLEGCRLTAYKLKGETYYTIGYGHYGKDVKKDMKITFDEAEALLKKDLEKYEGYVTKYALSKFPSMNENQFSALVSYCYNRGLGGLKELVNNSESLSDMALKFTIYWGKNANYKGALIQRRKSEQRLFQTSDSACLKYPVPEPVLKRGSMGIQVNRLQMVLNAILTVKLNVDGHFGPLTESAVKTFQKQNGLKVDGSYGPVTYKKMIEVIRGL